MEENDLIYDKSPSMTSEKVERTSTPDKSGMIYDRSLDKSADSTEYRKNYPAADETVFLDREPNDTYPNTDPGRETISRSEAPFKIMEGIYKASSKGNEDFLKTLGHYEKFLEGMSDEIEPVTMKQIRSFFAEGKNIKAEGREDFLKKVLDFAKTVSYAEY